MLLSMNLQLNLSKTKSQIFRWHKRDNPNLILTLNDHKIELVKHHIYLGLTIDNKLLFNQHITNLTRKVKGISNKLNLAVGKTWGMHPQILKQYYTSIIKAIILYGSEHCADILKKKTYIHRLRKLQRPFLFMISRAQRTVSNDALYALTGIPPIEFTIENRIATYKVKKGTTTASIYPYELPGNILRNGHPTERNPITTSIQNDQNIITCPVNHTHTIYTDGSKINGQVGAVVVIFDNNPPEVSPSVTPSIYTYKMDDKCSVFQAELIAIYKAVLLATTNEMDRIIHSESQAAIEGINNPQSTNNIILGIKECARPSPDRHVCVKWVRGHAGVKGNEAADHAAKNAAMSSLEPSYTKPPISHFKALTRRLTAIKWDKAWKQSGKGQVTRRYQHNLQQTHSRFRLPHHTISIVYLSTTWMYNFF